jgi:uncharacterized protein YndB with AHSA1/START domain
MKKLHFETKINAPVEKVYKTMLDESTYKEWTSAFSPDGSGYFKGSWEKGSKIFFIGTDPETGKEGGMVCRIAENNPNEFVSIEYVGILNDGVEDTTSDEAKKWTPGFENYTFKEENGITELQIDIDTADELAEEFEKMWPKALEKLKEIAEK